MITEHQIERIRALYYSACNLLEYICITYDENEDSLEHQTYLDVYREVKQARDHLYEAWLKC